MENNKISVGLDIGTTKIVAMIGRKNEYGKAEILGILFFVGYLRKIFKQKLLMCIVPKTNRLWD